MVNLNGSNAYQMRYEEGAVRKKRKEKSDVPAKKHVRPNMTVKLNTKRAKKPSHAPKQLKNRVRTLDAGEVRVLFAGGFVFCIIIAFFAFTMCCHARDNELTLLINQKKDELASLQNDYQGLMVERDNFLADDAIEDYAIHNLGMQKRESRQVKWFEVSWNDDFDE